MPLFDTNRNIISIEGRTANKTNRVHIRMFSKTAKPRKVAAIREIFFNGYFWFDIQLF